MDQPLARRTSDRVHNPNYLPRQHSSLAMQNFQQPAAQQPRFDPFDGRDPFRPSSRRDPPNGDAPFRPSGPFNATGMGPLRDTLQPTQPPPPSPFHSSSASSYGRPNGRRPSVEGYPTGPIEPPSTAPPAPTFSRPFPPPSTTSPKDAPSYPTSATQQPHSSSRAPYHRSSASMSISSMMGPSAGSPRQAPAWSPIGGRSYNESAPHTGPSSPSLHYASKSDPKPNGRPRTPDPRDIRYGGKLNGSVGATPQSSSFNSSMASDHQSAHGFSKLLQPFHHPLHSSSAPPQRPYSQPATSDGMRPLYGTQPHGQSEQPGSFPINERLENLERAARDRALNDQNRRSSIIDETFDATLYDPRGAPGLSNQQPRFGPLRQSDDRHDYSRYVPRERTPPLEQRRKISDGTQPQYGEIHEPNTFRSTQGGAREYSYSQHMQNGRRPEPTSMSAPEIQRPRTPVVESHLRRSIEEQQSQHRPFLGVADDYRQRLDRSSPLPQAVQGASTQPYGSERDPKIKNEFGRPFSGPRSGVGRTPVPQPPSYHPIFRGSSPPSFEGVGDLRRRTSYGFSAPNREHSFRDAPQKRKPDGPARTPAEINEGRMSPFGPYGRGGKRSKYNVPPMDQPVRQNNVQKLEDNAPTAGPRRASGQAQNIFRFPTANGPQNAGPTPATITRTPAQPKPSPNTPFHRPTLSISDAAVLKSIENAPRHHLGSQLYAPHASATGPISSWSARADLEVQSKPNTIPRFEGKENCTFTIRVPRYYLSAKTREQITLDRNVWGTGVYTDDSDPLAAAIHSGWLRGAWSPDVDETLLDLDPATATATTGATAPTTKEGDSTPAPIADPTERLTAPPRNGPPLPPPKHDMHLTIAILPTLQAYASTTRFGIKSRKWGASHDGMSFRIENISWVDEGWDARFEERGGRARRKRLRVWNEITAREGFNANGVVAVGA